MERDDTQQRTVPVIEEEIVAGTRTTKAGSVRIRKEVETVQHFIDLPTIREVAKVSRVAIDRVVTTAPDIREEGDVLIVPVLEERIVVQKQLVLKEEIHIQRERIEDRVSEAVAVERERATVERLDREGAVLPASEG